MTETMSVPEAEFLGPGFWQHVTQLADRDHKDHPRALFGRVDSDNVYRLWCQRCQAAVLDMVVQRSTENVGPEMPLPQQ